MSTPTRPILRYHGGKWKLAPWIISHFPPHRVYVEPFGGAASVLLRKPRVGAEVYNDLDERVVDLFRLLRDPDQAEQLVRAVATTPFARAELDASYEHTDDPVEAARRLIVMSFMGHSSKSVMTNTRNGFRSKRMAKQSPAVDWSRYPAALRVIIERLSGVVIERRDALEVVDLYDEPDALYYVDPPYVHGARHDLCQGIYRHELTDEDHEQLAEALHRVKGMVVLSGYPSALYDWLYADWRRVEHEAYADKASPRTECLWINPAADRARGGLLAAMDGVA